MSGKYDIQYPMQYSIITRISLIVYGQPLCTIQLLLAQARQSVPIAIKWLLGVDKVLGDPEVTANLYCAFAYLYWESCMISSIYLP